MTGLSSLPFDIRTVEETGSTNATLLADATAPHRSVLIARSQTAGRGRLGRTWVAPPGTCLTFSIMLRPPLALVPRLGLLPIVGGLALTDVIAADLKWPNDLLIGGKKLSGILAEGADLATAPRVVLGCGINVTLKKEDLPIEAATSLLIEGRDTDIDQLTFDVLAAMDRRISQWEALDPMIFGDYRRRCATLGQRVRVQAPAAYLEGVARDIDKEGAIIVDGDDGATHVFSAGDVTHLRPAQGSSQGSSQGPVGE